jgi:sulfite exporter TauE/SafE
VVNLLLICAGLHLAGVASPLRWIERAGLPVWRRVQPHAARLGAGRHAWLAGMAWGWLPCGLVYGALAAAIFAGSPLQGALAMLAFGLGTLPWLLSAGLAAQRLRLWTARRPIRLTAGAAVIAAGFAGLAQAVPLQDLLCL